MSMQDRREHGPIFQPGTGPRSGRIYRIVECVKYDEKAEVLGMWYAVQYQDPSARDGSYSKLDRDWKELEPTFSGAEQARSFIERLKNGLPTNQIVQRVLTEIQP